MITHVRRFSAKRARFKFNLLRPFSRLNSLITPLTYLFGWFNYSINSTARLVRLFSYLIQNKTCQLAPISNCHPWHAPNFGHFYLWRRDLWWKDFSEKFYHKGEKIEKHVCLHFSAPLLLISHTLSLKSKSDFKPFVPFEFIKTSNSQLIFVIFVKRASKETPKSRSDGRKFFTRKGNKCVCNLCKEEFAFTKEHQVWTVTWMLNIHLLGITGTRTRKVCPKSILLQFQKVIQNKMDLELWFC